MRDFMIATVPTVALDNGVVVLVIVLIGVFVGLAACYRVRLTDTDSPKFADWFPAGLILGGASAVVGIFVDQFVVRQLEWGSGARLAILLSFVLLLLPLTFALGEWWTSGWRGVWRLIRPLDLTKLDDALRLMRRSRNWQEWLVNADKVSRAHGGELPEWWHGEGRPINDLFKKRSRDWGMRTTAVRRKDQLLLIDCQMTFSEPGREFYVGTTPNRHPTGGDGSSNSS